MAIFHGLVDLPLMRPAAKASNIVPLRLGNLHSHFSAGAGKKPIATRFAKYMLKVRTPTAIAAIGHSRFIVFLSYSLSAAAALALSSYNLEPRYSYPD